ncbi:MAG: hypothetical protein JWQ38_265 [Flavipsychrobacter sp.]|nr:hypothetical protein [Flavipsychrobacter sp.]
MIKLFKKEQTMKKTLLSAAIITASLLATQAKAQSMVGITDANSIFTMGSISSPSSISGPYSVSGVVAGQALIAIDKRPNTGELYALGYNAITLTAQLYKITNVGTTYTATAIGSGTSSINLGAGNSSAFDFISSTNNQIRIAGRNGNNYVMDANTGSVISTGTSSLAFALGDVHVSMGGTLAATAYTNSYFGADNTQEVGFDATNNTLITFDAGNFSNNFNNTQYDMHSVGTTGTGLTLLLSNAIGMDTWFDTVSHSNTIFMSANTLTTGTHLYKYDLSSTSGLMTDVGVIGSGSLNVNDIAIDNNNNIPTSTPVTGQLVTALSLNLRNLITFDSKNPGIIRTSKALSGMTAGQTMIALDYAANGALYGLGYNSTSQMYQLYTIDTLTGAVTAVNTTESALSLGTDDGSGSHVNAGFRFVSTLSNKIRVTGNNGATNVLIDATTGGVSATDAALTYITGDANFGATANLTSIAYTGYNGDGTTQMFGYDANTGAIVKFNSSNSTSGYGTGASGFINTDLDISSVLSLFSHTSAYNNSVMDIAYDNTTGSNTGFILSNYNGYGNDLQNFSIMYDMTAMLSGYGKGTSAAPTKVGRIGYGTPVKDAAMRNSNTAYTTGFATVAGAANALLVYPNPAVGNTRIALPAPSIGEVNATIIDMNGSVLREYTYAPGTMTLDVDMSKLPSGLYSVRVGGASATPYNLKVVKQ